MARPDVLEIEDLKNAFDEVSSPEPEEIPKDSGDSSTTSGSFTTDGSMGIMAAAFEKADQKDKK